MTAGSSAFEWDSREVFSTCHIYWAQFSSSGKLYKGQLWIHCSSTFHYMLWATTLSVVDNMKGIHITAQPMKISRPSAWVAISSSAYPAFPLISLSTFPSDLSQLFRAQTVSHAQTVLIYGSLLYFKPPFRFNLQIFLMLETQTVKPLTRVFTRYQEMQMSPFKQSDSIRPLNWRSQPEHLGL